MKAGTLMALDWFYSLVPALDVAVRRWADGRPIMLHPARRPQQAALDRAGTERLLPWLGHENAHGADVYVRPARALGAVPLVLLDDLAPALARRVSAKYAALAVQTSGESVQVWIATKHALAEPERLAVQRTLAARVGADSGSVSGEHFGRLPGFTNRKPSRPDRPWVTVLATTKGRRLDVDGLLRAAPAPAPARSFSGGPAAARVGFGVDASRTDWHAARAALEAGEGVQRVIEEITARAIDRGKRATREGCLDYATRTVAKAARGGGHCAGRVVTTDDAGALL